jgi:hypothetical protein
LKELAETEEYAKAEIVKTEAANEECFAKIGGLESTIESLAARKRMVSLD